VEGEWEAEAEAEGVEGFLLQSPPLQTSIDLVLSMKLCYLFWACLRFSEYSQVFPSVP